MQAYTDWNMRPTFLTRTEPNIGWKRSDAGCMEQGDNSAAVKAFEAAVDLGAGRTYTAVHIPADPRSTLAWLLWEGTFWSHTS